MKNWKIPFVLLLLSSSLWLACDKDVFNGPTEGPSVNVTFAGLVLDENNQAVIGAEVRAGNQSTTTDANGVFRLPEISQPSNNAILQVRQNGFFEFSRAYHVENNSTQTLNIQLLRKRLIHSYVSGQSTTAQTNGAKLNFPANAIARADGSSYSGVVSVYGRYLDPTDPDLSRHMPGDLRGITNGGEEQTLATFGMIGVELTSPGGDPLNIAAGQEVEISLPIPSEKLAVAPAQIPLWHYDLGSARWVEEGFAEKIGDRYIGKVTHFSFWNCDDGFPIVKLNGKVYLENNEQPLAWATVKLTILSNGWTGFGHTDQNGCFGGSIPQNEEMLLEVTYHTDCGSSVLYIETIGPFQSNTTLPGIIVPPTNISTLSISGRLVDCNQQPVANGYAQINAGGSMQQTFTDASGNFGLTLVHCNSASLEVTGFNLDALTTSQVQTFSNPASPMQVGDITVCDNLTEYIQLLYDGQVYSFLENVGSFIESGSTSIYSETSNQYINFSFDNNNQTGTFPLTKFFAYPPSDTLVMFNLNTTVTQFGGPGQTITGTIDGTIQTWDGQNHTLSGSYQVNQ